MSQTLNQMFHNTASRLAGRLRFASRRTTAGAT